jgi:predicted sulfurtransferase
MVNNYPDNYRFKLNIVYPKPPCVHCEECSTPILEKDCRITVIQQDKRINYCSQKCFEAHRNIKIEEMKVIEKDGK